MANREHLARILENVGAWNDWRKANAETVPGLREADLGRAHLSLANLSRAELNGANLNGANLLGADLSGANLSRANLGGANLSGVDLRVANLTEADLHGADLSAAFLIEANLIRANLLGADLSDAFTGYTTFGDNDLSDVKGLETVHHDGPSTIGIDTIYRSHGKPLSSIPASSAIPPKIRNSPLACMPICKTTASAAGSRRTIYKPERRYMSRSTKRYEAMSGSS